MYALCSNYQGDVNSIVYDQRNIVRLGNLVQLLGGFDDGSSVAMLIAVLNHSDS